MENKRYAIGKVMVSQTDPADTQAKITSAVNLPLNGYVCIANMRSVIYGNQHEDYAEVLNGSFLTTPDGMPLVWCARCWGLKNVQRTTGPDLFVSMLKDDTSGIRHFLLGDTDETLAALTSRDEYKNIVGVYSPPFCDVDEFDYHGIAKRINESGANVVWVSLSAPKQDYFAVKLLPLLDKKIVIGVGAAFRFALGEYHHPNAMMQKAGLTGLFWRKGHPFKLLKTYIVFVLYLIRFITWIWFLRIFSNNKEQWKS